jgi:hypothetical protein
MLTLQIPTINRIQLEIFRWEKGIRIHARQSEKDFSNFRR